MPPTDPQLDARIVELTELGPAGASAAAATLRSWQAEQDLVPRLVHRIVSGGLGFDSRIATAELLVSWEDARVVPALIGLADSGDPTLIEGAVGAARRLPEALRGPLLGELGRHANPLVVASVRDVG